MDLSRRSFLASKVSEPVPSGLRPPWMVAEAACSGCGHCVQACPSGLLAALKAGRPVLGFDAGECTFCGLCAEACPEPVFDRAAPAFLHRIEIGSDCLARAGVSCLACGDSCPAAAIRFRPRIGGPALPSLDPTACTGCGACVGVCPAGAILATMPENADA